MSIPGGDTLVDAALGHYRRWYMADPDSIRHRARSRQWRERSRVAAERHGESAVQSVGHHNGLISVRAPASRAG